MEEHAPDLLRWARQLFSISQSGLTYCQNEFDLERYHQLQGIAIDMLSSHSELSKDAIKQSIRMQFGYATPKIDVRGAVVKDGKILLIQEQADGRWSMPGGWADIGDFPAKTVEREVFEESGYKVQVEKVIAVIDANHVAPLEFFHAYKLIFQCRILGGQARTSHETLAVDFFEMDNLPPLSTSRTTCAMLEEVYAHYLDPSRPTAFD